MRCFRSRLRPMAAWRWTKPVAAAAIFVGGFYCGHGPLGVKTTPTPRNVQDELLALYAWVKTHIPPGDLVVCDAPAAMYLQTGRQSPDYDPTTVNSQQLAKILSAGKAQWFVDDERLSGFADRVRSFLEQTPPLLKLAFRVGPYAVYRWHGGIMHDRQ